MNRSFWGDTVFIYLEWRYWLFGFGWRTPRQALVGYRFTIFVGPIRISFGRFYDAIIS